MEAEDEDEDEGSRSDDEEMDDGYHDLAGFIAPEHQSVAGPSLHNHQRRSDIEGEARDAEALARRFGREARWSSSDYGQDSHPAIARELEARDYWRFKAQVRTCLPARQDLNNVNSSRGQSNVLGKCWSSGCLVVTSEANSVFAP